MLLLANKYINNKSSRATWRLVIYTFIPKMILSFCFIFLISLFRKIIFIYNATPTVTLQVRITVGTETREKLKIKKKNRRAKA